MNETIFNEIYELEKLLQGISSVNYKEEYEELIADEFCEFGSSGRIYNKLETLEALRKRDKSKIEMKNFRLLKGNENIVHVVYITEVYKEGEDKPVFKSLRSSLWSRTGLKWEILFHQGTKTEWTVF